VAKAYGLELRIAKSVTRKEGGGKEGFPDVLFCQTGRISPDLAEIM